MTVTQTTWRFPRAFWIANTIELFERAAYYGTFIALAVFLTSVAHFTDVEAGWIGALFSALIYLLPFMTGAIADRVGFRGALLAAFAFLATGYTTLGLFPAKLSVLASLVVIAIGGALVKPIIAGTVAKTTDTTNRARGYSLFYMLVNIGSFSGKTIAKPVRVALGIHWVPLYSAGAAAIGLVLVALFYWPKIQTTSEEPAKPAPTLAGLAAVFRNGRFLALVLITSGFWAIQGQLYASMPKYVLRTLGDGASPEWYANVNPFMVVLLVVPITQLVRKLTAVTSIGISLALIPFAALTMAMSAQLSGNVLGMAPVTVTMIFGIALMGIAECFLSPRYLEFASRQAPAGQEGLYLGYAHLNTFVAWLFGFIASGYLLDAFCPDPAKLSAADRAQRLAAVAGQGSLPPAYAHAHYIWYVFAGVGATAFVALLIFARIVRTATVRERPGHALRPDAP